jgi:hypothetical protein
MSADVVMLEPRPRPASSRVQESRLVDRFLDDVRRRHDPHLEPAIEEVEEAVAPLHRLAQVDPDATREAEWTLSFSMLEGALLGLMRAASASARRDR